LHNKPLGCGASEVYASGPACEEEEEEESSPSNMPRRHRGGVDYRSTLPLTSALDGVGGQRHALAALHTHTHTHRHTHPSP